MSNRNDYARRALANAVRNARLARIGSMPRELRGPPDAAELHAFYGRDRVILEPHIDQDEVFDDQFERRAHEIQRVPGSDNVVSVVPAKQGPWSGNNQLGITRAFSANVENEQTILRLDEWGFPEVWTLTLGINDYSLARNPDPIGFAVTARIDFGAGGAMQTVEIDWLNGTSIPLNMNALNVVAEYTTGSGEGSTSIPDDLRLTATLGKGHMSLSEPIRTVVPTEGATSVEIPKFAKSVFGCNTLGLPGSTPFSYYSSGKYVQFTQGPSAGAIISTTYLTSQFVSSIDFANQLVGGPQWIPVPPFARFLSFLDAAGAPTVLGGVYHFRIGV
jgi:hypothetical protein